MTVLLCFQELLPKDFYTYMCISVELLPQNVFVQNIDIKSLFLFSLGSRLHAA
jgi:hypothetical protein